jgi:hypothetical protein
MTARQRTWPLPLGCNAIHKGTAPRDDEPTSRDMLTASDQVTGLEQSAKRRWTTPSSWARGMETWNWPTSSSACM